MGPAVTSTSFPSGVNLRRLAPGHIGLEGFRHRFRGEVDYGNGSVSGVGHPGFFAVGRDVEALRSAPYGNDSEMPVAPGLVADRTRAPGGATPGGGLSRLQVGPQRRIVYCSAEFTLVVRMRLASAKT